LEVRAPLLDTDLLAWCFALPPDAKIDGAQGKALLKRSQENRLPREVLYRRKQGFSMPLATWFRGPLAERAQALADPGGALLQSGLIDGGKVAQLVRAHLAGQQDQARPLWLLLMLDAFLRGPHQNGSSA
ncbi:MAG: asparagine synthase-related protein, partial [Pseudomonadota bacterium]